MKRSTQLTLRFATLGGALLATPAFAQDSEVRGAPPVPTTSSWASFGGPAVSVYNNVPGNAKNVVPGIPGMTFFFTTGTTAFDRPFGSANGRWILTALTSQATTLDEILIVDGALVAQEGTPAPWAPGENWGTFNTKQSINANGEYAFDMNVGPGTVNDDYVVKVTAGPTYTVLAQEGAAISYLPGVTYDDTLNSTVIDDNGNVGFVST